MCLPVRRPGMHTLECPSEACCGRPSTAVAVVQGAGGFCTEPELHLGSDVLVPDSAGWRRSRMPALPDTAYFQLAPDWVCEILSPSTASLDRGKKLAIYGREQVRHAWLVDPIARTLDVLELNAGRWRRLGTHAGSDVVRAEPFTEIELELASLWAD